MDISKRQMFGLVGSATMLGVARAPAKLAAKVKAPVRFILGTLRAPEVDQQAARDILSSLPKSDYFAIMLALANLRQEGSTHEPFNRRWKTYANPLLVDIWADMGFPQANDCTSWCGITLAWCLKRDNRPVPKECASSQSYLKYGTAVETKSPAHGDICVFTDTNDPAHGHVTIYNRTLDDTHIEVLGGNQRLSDETNCGHDTTANVIDLRSMPLTTGTMSLKGYVRPPPRG